MQIGAAECLQRIAQCQVIGARTALVVAHPDDETIGMGASMHLFSDLMLVHVTDGAPRDGADARAHGFAHSADYAAARRAELRGAMVAGDVSPALVTLDIPDQAASLAMGAIADRLAELLARTRTELVFTHAYEGGHPDHDATCWAVHTACARLVARPAIVEMPLYHAGVTGGLTTGRFLPGGPPATEIGLDDAAQARKRRMLDCFVTQRAMLDAFTTTAECFRVAQPPDFTRAPHESELFYEQFAWGMTGARWRQLAAGRQTAHA